jgi:hypothetical protein
MDSTAWYFGPSSSHVERFRLLGPGDPNKISHGNGAEIHVWFLAKGKYPAAGYAYILPNTEQASQIFDEIISDPSPGTVIHRRLIKPGVPASAL